MQCFDLVLSGFASPRFAALAFSSPRQGLHHRGCHLDHWGLACSDRYQGLSHQHLSQISITLQKNGTVKLPVFGVSPGELQLFMKGIGIHGSENDGRLNFGNENETSGIGGRSHNIIPKPKPPHTLHPTSTGTIVVCPLSSVVVSHVLERQSALLLACA